MKYLKLLIALLMLSPLSYSQTLNLGAPKGELGLIAKSYGDSIVLRWAIDKTALFVEGAKKGYKIERANLDRNPNKWEVIAEKHLPWSDTNWVKYSETPKMQSDSMYEMCMYFFFGLTEKKGQDKESFQISEDRDNLYAMLLLSASRRKDIAKAIGQSFTDKNISEETNYKYRLTFLGKTLYEVLPAEVKLSSEPIKNGSFPHEVVNADTKVHLNFPAPGSISSFFVYRANSRSGPWTQLNKTPRTMLYGTGVQTSEDTVEIMKYSDTGLTNYVKYYYKAFGIDGFGDTIEMFTAKGVPRDLTPPRRVVLDPPKHNQRGGYITLSWKPMEPVADDLYGFDIYRAEAKEGPWTKINDHTVRKKYTTYKDYKFNSGKKNWYYVTAKDNHGNEKKCEPVYAFVYDTDPPKTPIWVEGEMDSLGHIKLKIKSNKEEDLMGYRLFMANDEDHEFSPIFEDFKDSINQIIDTVFYDTTTLNTLTESIFYRVKALDYRYNESPFSKILEVRRIDTIPPNSPTFTDVRTDDKSISLKFNPSQSKDIKTQYIYRKTDNENTWTKVIELNKDQEIYVDTNVVPNVKYFYSLRAEDLSGNQSKLSFPVYSMTYNLNMQELVGSINFSYNKEEETLNVFWNANTKGYKEKDYFYVLYKKKGDLLREYKNTKNTPSFTEKNVKEGTYEYAVKVYFTDGTESKLSEVKAYTVEKE